MCQRMFRAGLEGGNLREYVVPCRRVDTDKISQHRFAQRQRTGLVKGHHFYITERLQGIPLTKQHTKFCRAATAHKNGGGCCQPHRAGAGNNQNRYPRHQRVRKRWFWAKKQPETHGQQGNPHHSRHKPKRNPIHQRLNRQPCPLGLLNHANDLRQCRVVADPRHLANQTAMPVHRTPGQPITCRFRHLHRLAGHHAFVNCAGALDHHRVCRNTFARLEQESHPDLQFRYWHLDPVLSLCNPRGAGLQADQFLNRSTGLPFGPCFKPAAQKDQCDDHRRRFEIDRPCARRQNRRDKQRNCRKDPGRPGAQCHKAVHIRSHPPQGRQAIDKELPPRPEQDKAGEHKLDSPAVLHPDGTPNQVMQRRKQMPAHLQNKDRE